jgi:excisionase family DNA binding protein
MEELPNILTAQDIATFLRIGRKRVYELMQLSPTHGGIPSFSVGKSRRVEKKDFLRWLAARKAG